MEITRFALKDTERSKIRRSSEKVGYIAVVDFAPLGRSRKAIRPVRTAACVTETGPHREVVQIARSYRNLTTRIRVYRVQPDGLAEVIGETTGIAPGYPSL